MNRLLPLLIAAVLPAVATPAAALQPVTMVAEVARRKALAVVLEQAVITDASGQPVDLEALRPQPEAVSAGDDVQED